MEKKSSIQKMASILSHFELESKLAWSTACKSHLGTIKSHFHQHRCPKLTTIMWWIKWILELITYERSSLEWWNHMGPSPTEMLSMHCSNSFQKC